jgi:hypothetical protein
MGPEFSQSDYHHKRGQEKASNSKPPSNKFKLAEGSSCIINPTLPMGGFKWKVVETLQGQKSAFLEG